MYLLENQAVGPPPPPPSPSDTLDLLAQVQKNTNISDSAAGAISHTPTPPAHPASSVTEDIFTAETEFKDPTTTPSASKFGAGLLHPPPATVHVTRLTDKQVRDRLEDLKTAKGDWLNIWFCVNHKKTQHATYKVHRLPSRVMSALNPDLYRIHREGTGAGEDIFIPNQQDSAYITHIEVKSRAIHTTLPSSQTQPTTKAGRPTPSTKPLTTTPGAPAYKNAPPVSRAFTTPSTFIFFRSMFSRG